MNTSKKIDAETVRHVAHLARLQMSEQEMKTFEKELESILEYVSRLDEIDTSGVQPMAHALDITNVFRLDTAEDSLVPEQALSNAPEKSEGHFRVPRVVE